MIAASGVFHDGLRYLAADLIAAAEAAGIGLLYVAGIATLLYGAIWLLSRAVPALPASEKGEEDH